MNTTWNGTGNRPQTMARHASATLVGFVLISALVIPGSPAGAAGISRPDGAGPQ